MDWLTYSTYFEIDSSGKPIGIRDVSAAEILARRLHDNSIEDETDSFLEAFKGPGKIGVVAIMGGHDVGRGSEIYRQTAEMARQLALDGYLVASGGGPGAMEAANLGAWFAAWPESEKLEAALGELSPKTGASELKFNDPEWFNSAWRIRMKYMPEQQMTNLGIPTWFYGHEPPNVFATHIAKYFENSLREEGLLKIATHGVIYVPGNGGTVQEVFQDGCQNYYADKIASPMILFKRDYWDPSVDSQGGYPVDSKPAWPLLKKLAIERKDKNQFDKWILLTSSTDEVLKMIRDFSSYVVSQNLDI